MLLLLGNFSITFMYKDDFVIDCVFKEFDDLKNSAQNLTNCMKDMKAILEIFESDNAVEVLTNIEIFTSILKSLIEDSASPFSNAMSLFNFSYYFLADLSGRDFSSEDFNLQVSRTKRLLYIFFENLIKIDSSYSNPSVSSKQSMN